MKHFSFDDLLLQRILPAVSFEKEQDVIPVTEALIKAGIATLEIAFRSAVAEKAVGLIRKRFPGLRVGAGTILSVDGLNKAVASGAEFGLSPGFNPAVADHAMRSGFPFIPGVMTPSEIELAAEKGFTILKLFPAEQLGGPSYLRAMRGPYTQLGVRFIPMGGVSPVNMKEYLHLDNVIAVGGSWLTPSIHASGGNYDIITELAKQALAIANSR
jgi:2-dehydro-3-deoxyphosphogluconate aldolase/(4S)-4-hydroxy-2-oxoglutarate aldolase